MMRSLAISLIATMLAGCAMPEVQAPDLAYLTMSSAEITARNRKEMRLFRAKCDQSQRRFARSGGLLSDRDTVVRYGQKADSFITDQEKAEARRKTFREQCANFDADVAEPCPALARISKGGEASFFSPEYLAARCEERERNRI